MNNSEKSLVILNLWNIQNLFDGISLDEGFSIFKNILIIWDRDHDERILIFIDSIPEILRKNLVICNEHEACLSLVWNGKVPFQYREGEEIEVWFNVPEEDNKVCDVWHIERSINITEFSLLN